jgi:hypothetical protein
LHLNQIVKRGIKSLVKFVYVFQLPALKEQFLKLAPSFED